MFTRGDISKPYAKFASSPSGQQAISKGSILRELQSRGIKVRNSVELDTVIKEHISKGNLPDDFKAKKKYSSSDHGPVDHYPQWIVDFLEDQQNAAIDDPLLRAHPRSKEDRMAQMTREKAVEELSRVQRSQAMISPDAEMRRQRMANRVNVKNK